jgi:hypothetical protein
MPDDPANGREPNFYEDEIQRDQLGPRGVPGKQHTPRITPQREKKTPKDVDPATLPRGLRGKECSAGRGPRNAVGLISARRQ